MSINKNHLLVLFTSMSICFTSCENGDINLFSIQDDIELGAQVDQEIRSDSTKYQILDEMKFQGVYDYLNNMKTSILNSGQVTYVNEFAWKLIVIEDDEVLNAFATPGGYIYIYTGLIKYLESASSLAGVLGHEIAHADERHSTEQLTKVYSISVLLEVIEGNQTLLSQITSELIFLKFSRDDETEADNQSVIYLCPTKYHADGAANFFQKLIDQGSSSPPQFLSTHPNPDNRVQNIHDKEIELGCTATISGNENIDGYDTFKDLLP